MNRQILRRVLSAGLIFLFVFFVLTSLGHMLCCDEASEHCPVCMALLKGREAWLLCGLCCFLHAGRKRLSPLTFRFYIRLFRTCRRFFYLTPVGLNVKMNN